MNIFEQASREKIRFSGSTGYLTVEQLWELPLTGDISLDTVSRKLSASIELTFKTGRFERSVLDKLYLSMFIVKHMIDVRRKEVGDEDTTLAPERNQEAKAKRLSDADAASYALHYSQTF